MRVRDEQHFLDSLIEHCRNDDFFLFGCDSETVVAKLYQKCLENCPAKEERFRLITAKTDTTLTDASQEFKGKFVFYSPKITFGVDVSIDTPQDVFIYIKGNSIEPSGIFQQATRCRNIRNLYYFGEVPERPASFNSLQDLKAELKENLLASKELTDACTYLDENDELQVIENSFFNIYAYNQYVKDTYGTNKVKHFELILEENGFELECHDAAPVRLDKETQQDLKTLYEKISEDLFGDYLKAEDRTIDRFASIRDNIDYLRLSSCGDDTLRRYRDYITDKYKIEEHDAVIRLLRSDSYIAGKLEDLKDNSYDVKTLQNSYHKISVLRQLEQDYAVGFLQVGTKQDGEIEMHDDRYRLIKRLFGTEKKKPGKRKELMKIYVSMIKHIATKEIVVSMRSKKKANRDEVEYSLNVELVKEHLRLNAWKNPKLRDFSDRAVELFEIEMGEAIETADLFLD